MTYDVLYDLTPLDISSRFTGIGKYVTELGRALLKLDDRERHGLQIGVLGGYAEGWSSRPLGPDFLPDIASRPVMENESWAWRRRTRLAWRLGRERPRLFHMTEPFGTPRGSLVPRVITCYDILRLALHEQYLGGGWVRLQLHRAAELSRYGSARRVLCISRFTADDLVRLLGLSASRLDVVPLAADAERYRLPRSEAERAERAAARVRLGLSERPYLVYVGAPDCRKNVDTLIQAFARARVPDVDLVLIGRYSEDQRSYVDGCLDAADRPANVRTLGYVADADMPAVYEGALALSFASSYEGFGLPVLEAMSCGCAVITSRATSLAEVAGEAAVFVTPRNVDELCDAIGRMVRESALRSDLREAGLVQAARFSWRHTALGTIESYRRALHEA
jgi:glycosyltransferase involved in cell wall biosynthesis